MKNKKILALDFDGVLWESAGENWEIGYLAYKKFSSTLPYNAKNNKKFLHGRYLARSGEDFYYIFKLMDESPNLDLRNLTRTKWVNFKKKHKKSAEAFTEEFYRIRRDARENNYKKWAKMQGPYPEMLKEIKKLKKYFDKIYVTSAKDVRSIKLLLKDYKLDFEVFGREHSIHKHEQLGMLKKLHQLEHGDIYFIDDCLENLEPLINSGVNIFMSGWGYNSKQEQTKAKKLGIPIVKLKNLLKQIKARGQALQKL